MCVRAPTAKILTSCVQVADDDSALRLESAAEQLLVEGDVWRDVHRADGNRTTSRSDNLHAYQTMSITGHTKHLALTQARSHQQSNSYAISIVRHGVGSILGPVASPKVGVGVRTESSLLDGDDGRC